MMPAHQRRKALWAVFGGAACAAAFLIAAAVFDARAAAAGWIIGFAFWAQVLIGCLMLAMIHRLTGGRWGDVAAPVILPTAAALPLLIVLAVPLLLAIFVLAPWRTHPNAVKPDVLSYYLNMPAYIVRTILALGGWTALSIALPRYADRLGQIIAALGLVFCAVAISGMSIDWYLSLQAPFTSSSFGAGVAISSLVAALAWTVAWAPAPQDDPAIGDLGGLLLAVILGITYIDFMAVLVIWYGDIPREEIWFVDHDKLPWSALAGIAFVFVSLVPVCALLLSRLRNAQKPLRLIGVGVLAGLACYDAYLIGPGTDTMALVTGLVAIIGIGLGLVGILINGATALTAPAETANAS